jgi:hypothetical protein
VSGGRELLRTAQKTHLVSSFEQSQKEKVLCKHGKTHRYILENSVTTPAVHHTRPQCVISCVMKIKIIKFGDAVFERTETKWMPD